MARELRRPTGDHRGLINEAKLAAGLPTNTTPAPTQAPAADPSEKHDPRPAPPPKSDPVAGTAHRSAKGPVASARSGPEPVTVPVTLYAPATGVYPYYDRAAAQMGSDALSLVLAKALDVLEADLQSGEAVTAETYPAGAQRLATKRRMPPAAFAAARRCFDPMELRRLGTLGRQIGETALVRFLRDAK